MKIGMIGLGLIGGSLAYAAKEKINAEIVAYSRSEAPLKQAVKDGIVSEYSVTDLKIFKGCDIVFICTPVNTILDYCEKLKGYVDENTVITDVGSTKSRICEIAQNLEGINFIGGHPMAGTEHSGYKWAKKDLFENAVYVVTPLKNTKDEHIRILVSFIEKIGARPVIMDSVVHDGAVAAVSHVPHIIAYSLANAVSKLEGEGKSMQTLAAGGFKDTTRIASSSPEVWCAICRENKENTLKTAKIFMEEMKEALHYLENDDYDNLYKYFEKAKTYRDFFNQQIREEK